jgi:hypothetical protein
MGRTPSMKHKKILITLLITGVLTVGVGSVLNSLVRLLNRGMPAIGYTLAAGKYVPITQGTKLAFLGDVILAGGYVLSVGDLFFFTGILTCLIALWVAIPPGRKFFPLLIISIIGIFWSIAQQNPATSIVLCETAAVVSVLSMYWSYRSSVRKKV